MAEILVAARKLGTHADPAVDRAGRYRRGMPVVVMPDNHPWGALERLPDFVVLKIPGVSVDKVMKYIEVWTTVDNTDPQNPIILPVQRRQWVIRYADLPAAAQNKLATTGELIIKAGAYNGPFDYTWTQVKNFFRDELNGVDETTEV